MISLDQLTITDAAKDKLRKAGVRGAELIDRTADGQKDKYGLTAAESKALNEDFVRMGLLPKDKPSSAKETN